MYMEKTISFGNFFIKNQDNSKTKNRNFEEIAIDNQLE